MTAFSDIGGRARLFPRPHEAFSPRIADVFADWGSFRGAPALELDIGRLPAFGPHFDRPDAPDVAAPAPGGLAAAVRPGRERSRPRFERPPIAKGWSCGVACSLGLHVGALTALLFWPTPVAETPPPESVTVEIIAEAPAPAIREAPPPPPAVAEAPLQPIEQAFSPVLAPPVDPPAAMAEPPPVAEPPPPAPPVVEARPVAETPPRPLEETPAPALATKEPAPAAEAPTPPAPPPQPAPVATPAAAPVLTAPLSAPARARLAAREPAPAASLAVSSAEAAAYQSNVLGRISAQKRYPEAARERAAHGVAVIRFSIDASGQLGGLTISQSAGDPILDAEALATVRRASPFPPPPAGAPRNFSAPLSFRVR